MATLRDALKPNQHEQIQTLKKNADKRQIEQIIQRDKDMSAAKIRPIKGKNRSV